MLRSVSVLPALLLFPPASAQDKPPADPGAAKPIVITGVRIADLRDQLAKCIARNCPPDRDIDASTALAEQQFVEGDYDGARKTLRASLSRNKGFAKDYPVPVSDLWRADSRIAAHIGAGDTYSSDTLAMADALRAGLPEGDLRILGARIEVGDMLARTGNVDEAAGEYRRIARRARELKSYGLEGVARLRVVALYASLAESDPWRSLYMGPAAKAADDLARDPLPQLKVFGIAAELLVQRLRVKRGDEDAVARMVDLTRAVPDDGGPPVMLYEPAIKGLGQVYEGSLPGAVWTKLHDPDLLGQWADIGFWIQADATVRDAEVLRGGIGALSGPRAPGRRFDPDWTVPLLQQISGRHYAAAARDNQRADIFRIERYTFTAWLTSKLGTRVPISGPPHYEMLDLSVDPPVPPAGTMGNPG